MSSLWSGDASRPKIVDMTHDPPSDVITISAWIECDDNARLKARLIHRPGGSNETLSEGEMTLDRILVRVRRWLEKLEEEGVTYCDTLQ